MDRLVFYALVKSNGLNAFMRSYGLLVNGCICSVCGCGMSLMRRAKNTDGEVWQCGKRACRYRRTSVRVGSVFEGMKKCLWQYMVAIYEWSRGVDAVSASSDSKVGKKTVLLISSFLRRSAGNWARATCNEKIGGRGRTVEIDETLIARRKYNRGRLVEQQWLFGGIERETGRFFLELVPDRSLQPWRR